MPKAAATPAIAAATTMRNTARAITFPRQRAGRRAIGLVNCIVEFGLLGCERLRFMRSMRVAGYEAPAASQPRRVLCRRETKVLPPTFASNLRHLIRQFVRIEH